LGSYAKPFLIFLCKINKRALANHKTFDKKAKQIIKTCKQQITILEEYIGLKKQRKYTKIKVNNEENAENPK